MIDRKTALICAALIALMLAAGIWRFAALADWTMLAFQHGKTVPSWLLLVFPGASIIVVSSLYWTRFRAPADVTKVQPWFRWGKFLALSYCAGLLLLQVVIVVQSLGVLPSLQLWAAYRTLGVVMAVMALGVINQMPKLPYLERSWSVGGDLGPIYGPRFMRGMSRVMIAFMIVVFAFSFAIPSGMAWRAMLLILLATACLMAWAVVWRRHLGRKWSLEQSSAHAVRP
jgi:hypothetical protein